MAYLKARKLLREAAKQYKLQYEKFSKKEIQKKMNEIKYLASQKDVPKLSLRKEITFLEHKLENVFELEKQVLASKRKESAQVSALKRQIKVLRERLQQSQDEDLREKVSKLSHLLGDAMAKSQSKKDVELSKELLEVMDKIDHQKVEASEQELSLIKKIKSFQERVSSLRHELDVIEKLGKIDSIKKSRIEEAIHLLEDKLETFRSKNPALFEKMELLKQQEDEKEKETPDSRHEILFDAVDYVSPQPTEQAVAGGNNQQFYGLNAGQAMGLNQPQSLDDFSDIDDQTMEDEIMNELPLPPPPKIR